jgi:hypothetical protein
MLGELEDRSASGFHPVLKANIMSNRVDSWVTVDNFVASLAVSTHLVSHWMRLVTYMGSK